MLQRLSVESLCSSRSKTFCCSQIRPAKFLPIFEVLQGLRTDHIFDLVWLDRTERSRAQHVNHIAGEDFASLDVTRCAQTATLHNRSILLISSNELIRRTKGALKQPRLFHH